MGFIKALLKKSMTCFVPAPEPEPEPVREVFRSYSNPTSAYHNGLIAGLAALQAIAVIEKKTQKIVEDINTNIRKINQVEMQYNPMFSSLDSSVSSMYSETMQDQVNDLLSKMQDELAIEFMLSLPSVPR